MSDLEYRREELCRALAVPYTSTWDEVVASARNAGIVRDAEYRHCDRVDEENQKLRRWLEAVSLGRATKETHADIRAYLAEVTP